MCQFAHSTWQKIGWLLSSLTAALALRRCLQQIAALPTFTQSLQHNAQCLKITEKVSFNIASEASYILHFKRTKFEA